MPTVHIYRSQDAVPDQITRDVSRVLLNAVARAFNTEPQKVRVRILEQHCHNLQTLPLEIDISIKWKQERARILESASEEIKSQVMRAMHALKRTDIPFSVNVSLHELVHLEVGPHSY